jgi:hypothetical protein
MFEVSLRPAANLGEAVEIGHQDQDCPFGTAQEISSFWLLGRLWKVRNCRIKANPSLRISDVDVEHGFEAGSIV